MAVATPWRQNHLLIWANFYPSPFAQPRVDLAKVEHPRPGANCLTRLLDKIRRWPLASNRPNLGDNTCKRGGQGKKCPPRDVQLRLINCCHSAAFTCFFGKFSRAWQKKLREFAVDALWANSYGAGFVDNLGVTLNWPRDALR